MAQTLFPIRRDDLVHMVQRFGFLPEQGQRVVSLLESQGVVLFNGPVMEMRDPSTPDAPFVAALANSVLGRTIGSYGIYKLKEYLERMERTAQSSGVAGRK